MDDSEYYSIMRKQYSHLPAIFNRKKTKQKDEEKFRSWSVNLGHDDAEMLDEKNDQTKDKAEKILDEEK